MRHTLINIIDGIRDPQKIDRCTYKLGDLLAVAQLTYLSGHEEYADMALFVRHRAREFGLFLYTDINPSGDTFERLFAILALQVAKATNDRLSVRKRLVTASMDPEYMMLLLKIMDFNEYL